MSTIRRATTDDVDALMRMGHNFIAYGKHDSMSIDGWELASQIMAVLQSPNMVVFVGEMNGRVEGMIVGAITSLWFAPSRRMAVELAWWVEEPARMSPMAIRLVRAYEQWATDSGAQFIAMSSLESKSGPDVASMLARLGYAKAETTHIKEV